MKTRADHLPLVLVAAVGRNRAIGGRGALLWRLPSDMRRFRAVTMSKPVIMGRKTWESIGRPLPGRSIFVVTRNPAYQAPGASVALDLPAAIEQADAWARQSGADEIIVAGGGEIYRQTIRAASRLRITEVDLSPPADAYFPEIDSKLWREAARETHPPGEQDEAGFAFVDYERAEPAF